MNAAEDYIEPVKTWWHIAYADRPGRFSYDRAEAIRIAEETGAQFVQERGGDRRVVWEAMEGSEKRRLAAKRAEGADVMAELDVPDDAMSVVWSLLRNTEGMETHNAVTAAQMIGALIAAGELRRLTERPHDDGVASCVVCTDVLLNRADELDPEGAS